MGRVEFERSLHRTIVEAWKSEHGDDLESTVKNRVLPARLADALGAEKPRCFARATLDDESWAFTLLESGSAVLVRLTADSRAVEVQHLGPVFGDPSYCERFDEDGLMLTFDSHLGTLVIASGDAFADDLPAIRDFFRRAGAGE